MKPAAANKKSKSELRRAVGETVSPRVVNIYLKGKMDDLMWQEGIKQDKDLSGTDIIVISNAKEQAIGKDLPFWELPNTLTKPFEFQSFREYSKYPFSQK